MTCYEKWSLLITGAGVLIGLGVLVVYLFQLRAMRASVDHAGESAANGKIAAEAAKRSADTLIATERAWIVIIVDLQPFGNITSSLIPVDQFVVIWPRIKNCGRSTARIKQISGRVQLVSREGRLPPQPEYPEDASVNLNCDIVVSPQMEMLPFCLHIMRQELVDAENGKADLYVHGFVSYIDVGGKDHRSGFCYVYKLQASKRPVTTGFYIDVTVPRAYTECT